MFFLICASAETPAQAENQPCPTSLSYRDNRGPLGARDRTVFER